MGLTDNAMEANLHLVEFADVPDCGGSCVLLRCAYISLDWDKPC